MDKVSLLVFVFAWFILLATPAMASSNIDYIHQQIGIFRQANHVGLSRPETRACTFAQKRAKEVATNFSHAGFNSTSWKQAYGSYHYVTENLAMTSDYKNVVNMWINSPSHKTNLLANTPYICVASYGNYYAMEGWRP